MLTQLFIASEISQLYVIYKPKKKNMFMNDGLEERRLFFPSKESQMVILLHYKYCTNIKHQQAIEFFDNKFLYLCCILQIFHLQIHVLIHLVIRINSRYKRFL